MVATGDAGRGRLGQAAGGPAAQRGAAGGTEVRARAPGEKMAAALPRHRLLPRAPEAKDARG